jgi:hypothetical protein
VFSAFGGLMLLVALAVAGRAAWRDFRQESALPAIFAAVAALALLGSMAMLPPETQFDRYIIPVIPCLVVVLCTRLRMAAMSAIPRWATLTSATSLCAIAIYSVLGTHDYFSEKRVRWTALQDLVKNDRVPPENVDAGWVYNAPTSFGVYGDPNDVDTWFKTQEYLVYSSLTPGLESVQGYTVVRSYPVQRWAPWNTAQSAILVMHRLAGPPG